MSNNADITRGVFESAWKRPRSRLRLGARISQIGVDLEDEWEDPGGDQMKTIEFLFTRLGRIQTHQQSTTYSVLHASGGFKISVPI